MAMSTELLIEQQGPILQVTINRPEQGNGMSDEMSIELTDVLDHAHERAELLLLRGAGEDFCIGRARAPNRPAPSTDAYERRAEYDAVFKLYAAFRRAELPVLGVIQGRAMGLGAALAASCDVSIASDAATFSIPEMAHNVMPTMVMAALHDRVNRNALLWMSYSADFITAERAMSYGLISTVVPAADLADEVARFCQKLLKAPRPALRGLKEYLRTAPTMDAQGAFDYARSLHAMVNTAGAMKKKA
jgi:enoyl-CoA hydratase